MIWKQRICAPYFIKPNYLRRHRILFVLLIGALSCILLKYILRKNILKNKVKYLFALIFIIGGLLATVLIVNELNKEQSSQDSKAAVSLKTVNPTEDSTTILKNPLMGFQDSNVNNNWYPWSTGYLRAGAACVENGRTVTCEALNWHTLNPQQGVYNFASIDLYLANMKERKKFMVFRVRNVREDTDLPYVPAWAANLGVTTSLGQESFDGRTGVEIDYHKCIFLDLWDDLVAELIRKYDNEPVINAVDIGSYGWYGEWFSGKSVLERAVGWGEDPNDPNDPTLQQSIDTRTRIIKMFTGGSGQGRCLDNNGQEQIVSYNYQGFKNKPVIMSMGDKEDLKIGIDNGAGARFDVVGSLSGQQNFRRGVNGFLNLPWQTKPVMGEFSNEPVNAALLQRSFCFAREFHYSSIHNNWNTKPSTDMNPLFRELGYRLLPTEIRYSEALSTSDNFSVEFKWINKGTAPAYQRYPLYLYIKPAGGNQVIKKYALTNTDITKILPASVTSTSNDFQTCPMGTPPVYEINESVTLTDLAVGTYDAYFGFEEPVYNHTIELALTQKDEEGLYLLGQFSLQDGTTPPPVSTYCGDGTVQNPNSDGIAEQCDDGNNINGDGCSSTCTIEETPVVTYCGDGIVQNPNSDGIAEQCDDGNTTNGDGCSSTCQREETYEATYCGDGVVQKPNDEGVVEQCDDGNNTNFDGCNAICQIETTSNTNTPPTGSGTIYVPQEPEDNSTTGGGTSSNQNTSQDVGVDGNVDDGDTPTSNDVPSNFADSGDNVFKRISDGAKEVLKLEKNNEDQGNTKYLSYMFGVGLVLLILSGLALLYFGSRKPKKQNTF